MLSNEIGIEIGNEISNEDGAVWGLHHGGRLVASLVVTGGDWPWLHGRVERLPGFDAVQPIFADDEAALDSDDPEAMDATYERVRASTVLTRPDGTVVAEYLLHIFADGTCGWRWSDRPFEE